MDRTAVVGGNLGPCSADDYRVSSRRIEETYVQEVLLGASDAMVEMVAADEWAGHHSLHAYRV